VNAPQLYCEFSSLTIPSDSRYAGVAARYAAEVARLIGFDDRVQDQISHGIQVALPALMQYSFETQERGTLDVSCERIPAGLKIVVRDKGLPFGDLGPWPADADDKGNAFLSLRDHFDEIYFNNLGPKGKEVVLVKHLADSSLADYEAACRLQPLDALGATRPLPQAQAATSCTVRPMEPSDALEISKTVYRTYGYSYSHDYIYYPEKIVALNASGEVHSALAVTEQNEIVGHCALSLWSDNPRIGEMGQGVVLPKYRSQGCFAKLTEYLIGIARSRGLKGVFGETVTVHPFSQKTALHHGLRDCALFLCLIPLTVDFKGLKSEPSARGSMLLQFKYLDKPLATEVYAPTRHADMLRTIYTNLDAATVPRIVTPPENATEEGESVYKIKLIRSLNFARIRVDRCGSNIVFDIRQKLRELCLQHWDVIHLILNLSDPQTPRFCRRFEELGFFFAGILPLGLSTGDALILQYLNTYCVSYGAIQTASRFASDLVDYVKSCDPNLTGFDSKSD
jgi:anti-sigma regulatory factor (Ser/Thr protein kinase)/GNAT superfamily N-acetyltransferase